ncbi:MAG: GAF domain-containing protein [Coriobacteriales bacterium]|jgi:hypothetical protein|nr:GAF domain-containing protein [Coriobacteriales bacterium]
MRLRVMVPTMTVLLAVFALIGVVVSNNISSTVANIVDKQMNATLVMVSGQMEAASNSNRLEPQNVVQNIKIGQNGGVFVLDSQETVIADSANLYRGESMSGASWVTTLYDEDESAFTFEFGGTKVYAKSLRYYNATIITYVPVSEMESYRSTPLTTTLLIGGVGLVLLGVLLFNVLTRVVLKPVERIGEQLESLTAGQRVETGSLRSPELRWVAQTINDALRRIGPKNQELSELAATCAKLKQDLEHEKLVSRIASEQPQHLNLLVAIKEVAESLATSRPEQLANDLKLGLKKLGSEVDAQRVVLWRLTTDEQNLDLEIASEWWQEQTKANDPALIRVLSFKKPLTAWFRNLQAGEAINALTQDLPSSLRAVLAPQGVTSTLLLPIFAQDSFWGLMEFSGLNVSKVYSAEEVQYLRSAATIAANCLSKSEYASMLATARTDFAQAEAAGSNLIQANGSQADGSQANVASSNAASSNAASDTGNNTEPNSEFLANIGQEIRTPLNVIIGMTIIGMASEDKEKKNFSLTKISEASRNLLGIVNDTFGTGSAKNS